MFDTRPDPTDDPRTARDLRDTLDDAAQAALANDVDREDVLDELVDAAARLQDDARDLDRDDDLDTQADEPVGTSARIDANDDGPRLAVALLDVDGADVFVDVRDLPRPAARLAAWWRRVRS